MATRTIVAFFEGEAGARFAADDLAAAGVERGAVAVARDAGEPALAGFRLPQADRLLFDEVLRHGGALLAARVPEVRVDVAIEALERAGAVDLDERERAWGAAAAEPAAEAPARHPLHREVGRGTSRVRSYYDPDDIGKRTVGQHDGDRMGLNLSHPARHGGL